LVDFEAYDDNENNDNISENTGFEHGYKLDYINEMTLVFI
jgi:hypothetical protein